jgi:hypothetical protein
MRKFLAGVLLIALSLWGGSGWANVVRVDQDQLWEHGIFPPVFRIISFSPDGRSLLGFQQTEREDIARGVSYRLFLIQLRSDGVLSAVRTYDLGIPSLEQAAFAPNGKEVVLITASGASFLVLDLATGNLRTLMEHRSGQPGFRAHPQVLWESQGRMLTLGYFYDRADFGGMNLIAEVDPAKNGVAAFREGSTVEPVERALKNVVLNVYTDQDTGYFATESKGRQTFYRWVSGNQPRAFDEAVRFTAFMACGDRVAYAAQRADGRHEVVLYDGPTGRKQVLGTSDRAFQYLTMSQDGSTIEVNQIDDQRMQVFTASARTGMTLRPLAGFPRCRVGSIRLTPDGRRMALYNQQGLQLVDIP